MVCPKYTVKTVFKDHPGKDQKVVFKGQMVFTDKVNFFFKSIIETKYDIFFIHRWSLEQVVFLLFLAHFFNAIVLNMLKAQFTVTLLEGGFMNP